MSCTTPVGLSSGERASEEGHGGRREGGIVPGEGGLFKEVESERRGGGLYTCMFIYLGIDTSSYFDIECRPYGCP